jgi:3',5'-cyclic AMP phosphodiesterase CpdA
MGATAGTVSLGTALTLICLDSNIPGSKRHDLWPWSFVLTRQQHDEQQQWLESELAKPRTTPFLAVAAHHPLYSNGQHRDNPKLIAQWDSLLRRHKVDLYLSGHDHDLQHLEFKGHPTSFVISGGGGAELVGWIRNQLCNEISRLSVVLSLKNQMQSNIF